MAKKHSFVTMAESDLGYVPNKATIECTGFVPKPTAVYCKDCVHIMTCALDSEFAAIALQFVFYDSSTMLDFICPVGGMCSYAAHAGACDSSAAGKGGLGGYICSVCNHRFVADNDGHAYHAACKCPLTHKLETQKYTCKHCSDLK